MRILNKAVCVALVSVATPTYASPAEEASAVVDRWSATYSANDRNALVRLYAPDALLLGTTDPVATRRTEAIREYFLALDQGGRSNTIQEKNVIVLGETAVVVAGFMTLPERNKTTNPDHRVSRL
ncbi:nuclear transport factor 2 family protein [Bradyrhizobium sp. USDA 223]|uniref:nuclear transport factor 2 family protein n=1 Tax=Bradyrhizobium sp. USDA 223 TaxID=3156306 RepID=UPI00383919AD